MHPQSTLCNSHECLATRTKPILSKVNQNSDWDNLTCLPLQKPWTHLSDTNQPTRATQTKHWVNQIALTLADTKYLALKNWISTQLGDHATAIDLPKGRAQQYYLLTSRDHEVRHATCSTKHSPFQPFPYITNMTNANTVSQLLRLRSQNSHIPSHTTSTGKFSPQSHTSAHKQYTCIPFTDCFCLFCLPPRETWWLAAPPTGAQKHTSSYNALHKNTNV
jgi:hypothetical protein